NSKKQQEKFEDAVKPALEGLLNDLQKTTEILRQKKFEKKEDNNFDINNDKLHLLNYGKSPNQTINFINNKTESQRNPILDSDKLGIHTIPKGDCPKCNEAVIGPVIIALGRMWHPDHFCCVQCGDPLGHRNFFERQGKAYCENDFHDLFSPRCYYCNGSIKQRCVTALGRNYHIDHFICADCGCPIKDEGFHERSNSAYCNKCFYRQYAPKCQGCKQPIINKFINALNTQWHPECFCCQQCNKSFNYFALPFIYFNRFLCEQCFHTYQGSLCNYCLLPISGKCISTLNNGQKFHPEHFS
ncbi:hypothetical protein Mgra_00004826, partial [Meloidogyne graminicola]